jgi:hypothetical protein
VNLNTAVIEIPCPGCKFPNAASLRELRFGLTIPCRGCKTRIRIVPMDAGLMKAEKAIEEFISDIPKQIEIKIKL